MPKNNTWTFRYSTTSPAADATLTSVLSRAGEPVTRRTQSSDPDRIYRELPVPVGGAQALQLQLLLAGAEAVMGASADAVRAEWSCDDGPWQPCIPAVSRRS